jgi:hypothetical protein
MEQSQLMIDLSNMIEYKINQRNELSKKKDKPIGIIQIIDREIDILLKIEMFIPEMEKAHKMAIHSTQKKYFSLGVQSGKLEYTTGRPHPEYYFQ